MRAHDIARELISAILRPDRDKRPIVKLAILLEEALNEEGHGVDPTPMDPAVERFALLEIE